MAAATKDRPQAVTFSDVASLERHLDGCWDLQWARFDDPNMHVPGGLNDFYGSGNLIYHSGARQMSAIMLEGPEGGRRHLEDASEKTPYPPASFLHDTHTEAWADVARSSLAYTARYSIDMGSSSLATAIREVTIHHHITQSTQPAWHGRLVSRRATFETSQATPCCIAGDFMRLVPTGGPPCTLYFKRAQLSHGSG
ncbi:hypothetical protein IE81DRAFT_348854 [Ceraceosorus guamensis]|uniref:Lipocalin-like domain-containing protein n=1 Tax=Ceraceosorus guamensis TaxID=1522189 RepID=A0A316VUB9_9BASI|nr:hypothetical protein IE81DRAFT_348854 [Ceraceosorus guamensis]PWN40834.1 hypothetical protein IE81DRAFT_348854 [Ceraceosorus guamensis]